MGYLRRLMPGHFAVYDCVLKIMKEKFYNDLQVAVKYRKMI